MYCGVIGLAVFGSLLLTCLVLNSYGINRENHGLFVKLLGMKRRGASGYDIGEALFKHVRSKMGSRSQGVVDIAPADMLEDDVFEEAMTRLVGRLLDEGFKPVSIDRDGHSKVWIGE